MLQATDSQCRHLESIIKGRVDFASKELFSPIDRVKNVDELTFDQMAQIVDFLRSDQALDESKALFEQCWIEYKRKGSKKKSRYYWEKLSNDEKERVLPHIKYYVKNRELRFQKDFERYLRDKIFLSIVLNGNDIVYDPSRAMCESYSPAGNSIWYSERNRAYWTSEPFYDKKVDDSYSDENRPDGAELVLNNDRGVIIWSKENKSWNYKN